MIQRAPMKAAKSERKSELGKPKPTTGTPNSSRRWQRTSKGLCKRIHNCTHNDESSTQRNAPLATKGACNPVSYKCGEYGWEEYGRGTEAQCRTSWVVEVGFPKREGLKAVKKILVVSKIINAKGYDHAVRNVTAQARILVPGLMRIVLEL
jgi:hypothetical protein